MLIAGSVVTVERSLLRRFRRPPWCKLGWVYHIDLDFPTISLWVIQQLDCPFHMLSCTADKPVTMPLPAWQPEAMSTCMGSFDWGECGLIQTVINCCVASG